MTSARLLVVEDEAILAMNIENKVLQLGYQVTGVTDSGSEAIRLVDEIRPDLVLMDIKLKGKLDGVETAEQIRERFDIPVIYLIIAFYAPKSTLNWNSYIIRLA